MTLEPGSKLGPYEIESAAGAGGMGEVYKARDSRLDRMVAIKVLPSTIAGNPDLRARFEREAKAISSLNHPNICTLHDIGHENGTEFLVMEYIEGETLAERLEKGPVPTQELLQIAVEVADALDKAHRQGLIHRDLKPGNIMLTKQGAKLLDFGLAKLQEEGGVVKGISGITATTPLTGEGMIVGTMQYMAPEQLEAGEVDARSDIFSFGAVLYQMATGQRPFEGRSQASLIAAIIEREPTPISEIKPLTPPALERVIRKCMAKDPDSRWQSARDMSDEIRWIAQSGSTAGIAAPIASRRRLRLRLGWIVAAVMTIATAALAFMMVTAEEPEVSTRRFAIQVEDGLNQVGWPKISPDGKLLAFQATDSVGKTSIWIRPMNSLDAYPLPGTDGTFRPFWSPDSKYLAFFVNNQLKKVPAAGGPVQLICEANGADGCWGSQGIILFDNDVGDSIRQVPASGGIATAATIINRDRGEQFHSFPWFLPDGKHFLYLAEMDTTAQGGNKEVHVGSIDGSVDKMLFRVDSRIEYAYPGYILHWRDGVLQARPFDADKLEITGENIPVAEDIAFFRNAPYFGTSDEGTMVFQVGANLGNSELVFYDRKGNEISKIGEPAPYRDLALSPDGNRLAFQMVDEQTQSDEIWVYDLRRNIPTRLTFDESNEIWPVWSPDGTQILYASDATGRFAMMIHQANGLGQPQRFLTMEGHIGPSQWCAANNQILVSHLDGEWDIWTVPADDTSKLMAVTNTPHQEWRAQYSPNGRYVAYQSNESGRYEIYVREMSESGGKWQISADGGYSPQWRADGKELFYYSNEFDMTAVPVVTDQDHFEAGIGEKLFRHRYNSTGFNQTRYQVSADGQRFLFNVAMGNPETARIVAVQNWAEELKQR